MYWTTMDVDVVKPPSGVPAAFVVALPPGPLHAFQNGLKSNGDSQIVVYISTQGRNCSYSLSWTHLALHACAARLAADVSPS